MQNSFYPKQLSPSDIASLKNTGVLSTHPIIDPKRLVLLHLSYIDFKGQIHTDGRMMVLDAVAPYVANIFRELFERKFPIHKISLMNDYLGNDAASMAANNTSAFCDRPVTGASGKPSLHAYGLAFDINPVQNPYIQLDLENGTAIYSPKEGIEHANRLKDKPARLGYAEDIIDICQKNGFNIWGGHWNNPIDYQHFQTSREMAEKLISLEPADAKGFFAENRGSTFPGT